MSDDEDILHPRRPRRAAGHQPFQHPDDEEEEEDMMNLASDSDGEAEQVQTRIPAPWCFTTGVPHPHSSHTVSTVLSLEHYLAGNKTLSAGR